MGVSNFELINTDFQSYEPTMKYGIVYSNGFIEHFRDYNMILDNHLKYLEPKGMMMVKPFRIRSI
jgi:trans-aconitate methyltransferase